MNKPIRIMISILLTVFLFTALFPANIAMAAGNISLTVTPSTTTAKVGDEVTFTVSMGSAAGTDFLGFQFDISIPAGLTFKPGSGTVTLPANGWMVNLDETPKLMATGFGPEYNGIGLDLMTFVCTVNAPGSYTVTLTNVGLYDGLVNPIMSSVTSATVNVGQANTSPSPGGDNGGANGGNNGSNNNDNNSPAVSPSPNVGLLVVPDTEPPQTGDGSIIVGAGIAVLLLAVGAGTLLIVKRRKKAAR